jgi:hypothetical protein
MSSCPCFQLFFDDANAPSLLSLPYLGWIDKKHALYIATRNLILGDSNPFFFRGSAGEGVGSPHVPWRFVWPMSITMRALTSNQDDEIIECLNTLRDTTAGNSGSNVFQLALSNWNSFRRRHKLYARELQHQQRKRFHQALVCVGQHTLRRPCSQIVSGASMADILRRCAVNLGSL